MSAGIAFISILLNMFLIAFMYGNLTLTMKITDQNKFKINDSVYQCKQVQKLEYGEQR